MTIYSGYEYFGFIVVFGIGMLMGWIIWGRRK